MTAHRNTPPLHPASGDIAIVGIGCRYPGARDTKQLWENILARRQQFRRMPDARLPLHDYQDDDRSAPDKTYGTRAAVIDGYAFDWAARRIPKQAYESTDLAHWLALDVALQALQDAGYAAAELPRETTQVVVGNTLTGEFTRSNTLRARWPFVRRMLVTSAVDLKLPPAAVDALERTMAQRYKSVFMPTNEDTLAGGLANTIAGRICNFLNLNGGGYVVDGACASSLIAVHSAAASLASRTADFVIAGGVDISLDPFELVGFAKTGALTPTEMSVYDKRGNGFIPGEGCGFVAMKRLADAVRDGDKVYAVLDGWGMSSDGKGGITAPTAAGQSLALRRAHGMAGIDPDEIDFIEGHGTGTAVGDKTELLGIALALKSDRPDRPDHESGRRRCGVTSFKSIVGHTKAAAGVGAFIKAALAVNQRVVPPTAGCELPHEAFSDVAGGLYPVIRGQVAAADGTLRAGVSAMGFGGINVHVTLRSGDAAPVGGLRPDIGERAAMVSRQDSEVFALAGATAAGLREAAQDLQARSRDASLAELADLAADCNRAAEAGLPLRAAVVAGTPVELSRKLGLLIDRLGHPLPTGTVWTDADNLVVAGARETPATVGFVFPGQGSQRLGMARMLVERFDWAADLVRQADEWAAQAGTPGLADSIYTDLDRQVTPAELSPSLARLQRTQLAQPAIVLCSLLWLKHLDHLGIGADVVLGHSLGELTAFHAAGAFDERTLVTLATLRGQLMAEKSQGSAGAMAGLGCNEARAKHLMLQVRGQGVLVIANLNSAAQTVVSGEAPAIEAVCAAAEREGIVAHRLPVANAFHSPLVAQAAHSLYELAALDDHPARMDRLLISSCNGEPIGRDVKLRDHFAAQITRPVDFIEAARSLRRHCDLAIEVGPAAVLSNLIASHTGDDGRSLAATPVERHAESAKALNWTLALVHAHGRTVRWAAVQERRVIRPFLPAQAMQFIVNPCERPFERAPIEALPDWQAHALPRPAHGLQAASPGFSQQLADYLAQRGDFIADIVKADLRAMHPSASPAPSAATAVAVKPPGHTPAQALAAPRAAGPAEADGLDVHALVLQLAARATGFPGDQITLQMSLLDELNLDSIKAGALVADACAAAGVAGALDASATAGVTLGGLAEAIASHRERARDDMPAASPEAASALPLLIDLAARYTGFDVHSLTPSLTFADDLNLDSIKFASLVLEATTRLGVEGRLTAADAATDSIEALAARLDALVSRPSPQDDKARGAPMAVPGTDEIDADWARCHRVQAVAQARGDALSPLPLAGSVVAIQCDMEEGDVAEAIARAFEDQGAIAWVTDAATLLATPRLDLAHFVTVLRREPASRDGEDTGVELKAVQRLRAAAVASSRQNTACSLTYVQFNGFDGTPAASGGDLQTAAASAFAASVHFERPALRVRVLDFDAGHAPDAIACETLAELSSPDAYALSHHGLDGRRHVFQALPVEPQLQPVRDIAWDSGDVVIVTGGAKGITAECAHAFAQSTGARMVLVGSSPAPASRDAGGDIAATLERFAADGLSAAYAQCDIADPAAVDALVKHIEHTLGPVTGLIHGAGANRPRRVEQSTEEEALREVSPKLLGFRNFCAALAQRPPRMIVALTSIIGVTGMPGNAWYAFSNEALRLALQGFRDDHPGTQTVALAYSVWSEVGMGARMGSTRHLAAMGISAIPPHRGVAHFLALALRRSPADQVVIAGRLGGLDTWKVPPPTATDPGRFIDELLVFEPGIELVNRVRLSLDDDPYLRDHYYRGVYLFPTVFGLEAMAQAVARLLGRDRLGALTLQDIGLERPIVVGGESGALIEVRALVQERGEAGEPLRVRVGIRTQHTGFRVDHFSATFVLAAPDAVAEGEGPQRPAVATDLDPRVHLYGGLLFQGPLFQRMRTVWSMDSGGSVIDIEGRAHDAYFAARHPQHTVLGDPALRDVLLQSAQLSEKGVYLPVHIDSLGVHAGEGASAFLATARTRVVSRAGDELVCDVVAALEDGTVVEQLQGYRLKRMALDPLAPSPEDHVDPQQRDSALLARALDEAGGALKVGVPEHRLVHTPELARMDRSRRRLSELPLFTEVLLQAFPASRALAAERLEIHWREDGKPMVGGLDGERADLSLSHDRSHCLCVAGDGPQGCDIEPIEPRPEAEWTGLLGRERRPLLQSLVDGGDTPDQAGTRLWCAIESLHKALGDATAARTLSVARRAGEAVVFTAEQAGGTLEILTLSLALTRLPRKMVAMVVVPVAPPPGGPGPGAPRVPAGADPAPASGDMVMARGPQGQLKPCVRFRTTFKDTTTLRNSLDYPVFANWMGDVRELSITGIAHRLVPDFASGEWGMVTNASRIDLHADAHCLDLVEGRMYISRAYGKFDSSIDMHFEWLRVGPDGELHPLASSTMSTTWVRIKGHGLVEVQPFPPYLAEFVAAHLPEAARPGPGVDDFAAQALARRSGWAGDAPLGERLYEAPHAPKVEPELARQVFSTTSAESNLVGNIYFANYYHWQKRVIDRFFHRLAPELHTAAGRPGEFHWRHGEVNHLREAMPFDRIEVVMGLKSLFDHGLRLHFDFFRLTEDGQRQKLAHGECEAAWVQRGGDLPSPIPARYRDALREGLPATVRSGQPLLSIP
jgi:enediyne polyketide synthase